MYQIRKNFYHANNLKLVIFYCSNILNTYSVLFCRFHIFNKWVSSMKWRLIFRTDLIAETFLHNSQQMVRIYCRWANTNSERQVRPPVCFPGTARTWTTPTPPWQRSARITPSWSTVRRSWATSCPSPPTSSSRSRDSPSTSSFWRIWRRPQVVQYHGGGTAF